MQAVPRGPAITARLYCLRACGRLLGVVSGGHVFGDGREHVMYGLPARNILDRQGRNVVLELSSWLLVAARSDIVLSDEVKPVSDDPSHLISACCNRICFSCLC